MIKRMRHYHNCIACNDFGGAYRIIGVDINTILCKKCLQKLFNKIGGKE